MGEQTSELSPGACRIFRMKHNPTQVGFSKRLGLHGDGGRRVRKWEEEIGAPPYIAILFAYLDAYGFELLDKMVAEAPKNRLTKLTPDDVRAFRDRHKLTGVALSRLLGAVSQGRGVRLWEAVGAQPPAYLRVLFAYADEHGLDVMEKLAVDREAKKVRR
jgi:DNA-binding transcriptional regulator YiaG